MNKIVMVIVSLLGLALTFGINAGWVIAPAAILLIIAAAFSVLTGGRPKHFWPLLGGLLFGPILVAGLLQSLLAELKYTLGPASNSTVVMLSLIGLMVGAFLYVRARINHLRDSHSRRDTTNERQPLFPVRFDHED